MNSASSQNLFLPAITSKCKIKLSMKFKNFSSIFSILIITVIFFILIQVHYFLLLILFLNYLFLFFVVVSSRCCCFIIIQLQQQKCFAQKKLTLQFRVNCQLIRRFSDIDLLCIFQVKSNLLANCSKNLYIFLTYLVIFQSHLFSLFIVFYIYMFIS